MIMKWWGWGAEDKQADLSQMPALLPYIEKMIGCDVTQKESLIPFEKIQLSPPKIHEDFLRSLMFVFKSDQIEQSKLDRLRHAYGKSFRDLYRMRNGLISRAPDVVIYPENTDQVVKLLSLCNQYNICLIPFGGGTNIVGAVEADAAESRMVVCCDLARMNKVLSWDSYSRTAIIQAGALGPDLEKALNQQGFSLGHFPDSFQFSTLGGWIATRSVGMQSDQYGTISDHVLGMTVATPKGVIHHPALPHASCGPDWRNLWLGSEGTLGVITEAAVKIHPLPPKADFGAVLFPTFSHGIQAIHACVMQKKLPHMMRLMDNEETRLSFHLKPKVSRTQSFLQAMVKRCLRIFKHIKDDQCAVLIVAFQGSASEIRKKRKAVLAVCRKFQGYYVGRSPGKTWYQRKYDYPYLRDAVMDFGCVVDVAETATTWSQVMPLYQAVRTAGWKALDACTPQSIQNKIGRSGYVGCHLSHNYDNGACLYFTFCFSPEQTQALQQYDYVKKMMTQAIVDHGGALSHHHSIGYEHAPWLTQFVGQTNMDILTAIKQSLDPQYILNSRQLNLSASLRATSVAEVP